jgi:hypothetical protein
MMNVMKIFVLTTIIAIVVVLASTGSVYAGTETKQADSYENSVKPLDSYNYLQNEAVEQLKKLKIEVKKQIEEKGTHDWDKLLHNYYVQKNKVITDTIKTFEVKRRKECIDNIRLLKSSIGTVRAGRTRPWGPRKSDRIEIVITADANKWQRIDGGQTIQDISKHIARSGSGEMNQSNPPNGYSVLCSVRGPELSDSASGHSWWEFKLIVPYKPADDNAFKDAGIDFQQEKLQFEKKLQEQIVKDLL